MVDDADRDHRLGAGRRLVGGHSAAARRHPGRQPRWGRFASRFGGPSPSWPRSRPSTTTTSLRFSPPARSSRRVHRLESDPGLGGAVPRLTLLPDDELERNVRGNEIRKPDHLRHLVCWSRRCWPASPPPIGRPPRRQLAEVHPLSGFQAPPQRAGRHRHQPGLDPARRRSAAPGEIALTLRRRTCHVTRPPGAADLWPTPGLYQGHLLRDRPQRLGPPGDRPAALLAAGHTVGSLHTFSHPNMARLSGKARTRRSRWSPATRPSRWP